MAKDHAGDSTYAFLSEDAANQSTAARLYYLRKISDAQIALRSAGQAPAPLGGAEVAAASPAATRAAEVAAAEAVVASWTEQYDEGNKRSYYANKKSGETT